MSAESPYEKLKTTNAFYEAFDRHPDDEDDIVAAAIDILNPKDLQTLKTRISKKKEKLAGKASTSGSFSVVDNPDEEKAKAVEITPKMVEQFWAELEKLDPVTLLSSDVLDAFKYVGYDPDIVMREFLSRGKTAKLSMEDVTKDLVNVVTIAIIKGSVTEKNLKKTSDTGKVFYSNLQKVYNLISGGAKGADSTHLTVARVAAAVPGLVIQVLVKKPEFAKTFIGPFGSKSLPPYLRHQAAAACVPEGKSEKLKDFILGLITAYTADQTKTLAKSKEAPGDLYDIQLNYVMTTHGGRHPSEALRSKIFSSFSLSKDYEKLLLVAQRIKKIKPDFQILSQTELDDELAK